MTGLTCIIGTGARILLLFQICHIIHSVEAINCYYCAWIDAIEEYDLPSLRGRIKDVCRPQNFNPNVVHTDKCRHGCVTTTLHEASANCSSLETTFNSFVFTKAVGEPVPATRADVDLFPPLPITFFYRGCPNNHTTKLIDGCEFIQFKNGCQQRTCYCTTELCNGEVKSGAPKLSSRCQTFFQNPLAWKIPMVFIISMRLLAF